ncbi:hypothetical protein OTERR_13830 [Oryzomicrobium terrae]|uniref:Uncharacterized protein n=1 Tax=Oryzomicrobium terrae TaxID=1735038 RepID=A0A5C1E8B4_9RHOO|nr:hypothetical protein [Oryzomicrobium terrae]QEL64859.1 hypothetical protein OTERR_13830 [Oryzomicrobium terrae]
MDAPLPDSLETARLLARFKLQVRRTLDQSVSLEQLAHDPDYAKARLAEIEDAAEDEELLVMVLRLRALLLPAVAPAPAVASTEPTPSQETRTYKFGARSW